MLKTLRRNKIIDKYRYNRLHYYLPTMQHPPHTHTHSISMAHACDVGSGLVTCLASEQASGNGSGLSYFCFWPGPWVLETKSMEKNELDFV